MPGPDAVPAKSTPQLQMFAEVWFGSVRKPQSAVLCHSPGTTACEVTLLVAVWRAQAARAWIGCALIGMGIEPGFDGRA